MTTIFAAPQRRGVRKSETVIDRGELADLRRLARRGAAYEGAARSMRNRHAEVLEKLADARADGATSKVEWCAGWLAAMRELAEEVVKR